MLKNIVLLCLSIIGLVSYAQTEIGQPNVTEQVNNSNQFNNSDQFIDYSNQVFSVDLRDKKLKGSVYINKDFLPAKLSNNNIIYTANYDAYKDQIVIDNDGKLFTVAKIFENEVTFVNNKKIYKVYNYIKEGQEVKGFFVIQSSGIKMSLLVKESIKYFDEVEAKTGYDEYKPPSLKREKDKLYFGFNDHSTLEIPKKKKDILKVFKDKEVEMEKYVKKKKLNPKKQEDLIEMVTFYNKMF